MMIHLEKLVKYDYNCPFFLQLLSLSRQLKNLNGYCLLTEC